LLNNWIPLMSPNSLKIVSLGSSAWCMRMKGILSSFSCCNDPIRFGNQFSGLFKTLDDANTKFVILDVVDQPRSQCIASFKDGFVNQAICFIFKSIGVCLFHGGIIRPRGFGSYTGKPSLTEKLMQKRAVRYNPNDPCLI